MKRFLFLIGLGAATPGFAEVSLPDLVTSLENAHAELMATVPGYFSFQEGETGATINDGGNDMYDSGNILNTDLMRNIPYTNGEVSEGVGFGASSSYLTLKLPGLFIAAAVNTSIDRFEISGNLGADGGGNVTAWESVISHFGSSYKLYVKQVYNANDPSVNHLIIVPDLVGLTRTYSTDTDNDEHIVTGLETGSSVFYALVAGEAGKQYSQSELTALAEHILPFIAADVGGHNCLVRRGEAYCFGRNDFGQLGQGDAVARGDEPAEMESLIPVDLGSNFVVASVAVGRAHTCVASEAGQLKCFGANEVGQLGLGDTRSRGAAPGELGESLPEVNLGEGFRVSQVAAGFDHTCALSSDGRLKCWGGNEFGQLGAGNTNTLGDEASDMGDSLTTVDFGSELTVRQVAASFFFTCVLLSDDSTRCFGAGGKGQLGNGLAQDVGSAPEQMGANLLPVRLTGVRARTLSLGAAHGCVVATTGRVYCWGDNGSGELGTGDVIRRGADMETPLMPVNLGGLQFVDRLACGYSHCCAKTIQGTMKCWGKNGEGQLATGDRLPRGGSAQSVGEGLPFVALPPLTAVDDVWAGSAHTCISSDEDVRCWGLNNYGQLGQGDTLNRGDTEGTLPLAIDPIALP